MIKVNFLKEIKEKELVDIKDIISGTQFENLFGGKQRILIPVTEKFSDYKQITYSYDVEEKIAAEEYMKVFEELLKECKTEKSEYKIDYPNAFIIKKYQHTNPKTGENFLKEKKVSLSKIVPYIIAGFKNNEVEFSQLKKFFDDVPANIVPVLSDSNSFNLYFKVFAEEQVKQKLKVDNRKYAAQMFPWLLGAKPTPYKYFIETLNKITEYGGEKIVVISRAPVDLIRMSDFPAINKKGEADYEKGIVSCHSPMRLNKTIDPDTGDVEYEKVGGSYYDCAVEESRNNGAIAFLISKKSLEGYEGNVESKDFFKDIERSVKGPYPIQRLRMRRYYHLKSKQELLVPEITIYPQGGSLLFKSTVDKWCRETQSELISKLKSDYEADVSDYILIGGSYTDNSSTELLQSFLGIQLRIPGKGLDAPDKQMTEKTYSFDSNVSYMEMLRRAGVSETYRVISEPGFGYYIDKEDNLYKIEFHATDLFIDFAGVNKLGTEEEFNKLILDLLKSYSDADLNISVNSKIEDQLSLSYRLIIKTTLNRTESDKSKLISFSNILNKILVTPEGDIALGRDAVFASIYKDLFGKIMNFAREKHRGRPPGVTVRKQKNENKKLIIKLRG